MKKKDIMADKEYELLNDICPLSIIANQIHIITQLANTKEEALIMGRFLSFMINDTGNFVGESIENFFNELETPIYCQPKELDHIKSIMAASKHKRRIIVMEED